MSAKSPRSIPPSGVMPPPVNRQPSGWHDGSLVLSGVNTQPWTGSQLSSVLGSLSLQVIGPVNTQPVAGSQVSTVQRLLSSQTIGVLTQPVAGLHVSSVQASLSSQSTFWVGHSPATHVSVVQKLLSSQ